MKKYFSLMRAAIQTSIAYRGSFFIELVSGLMHILSLFFLWQAIYKNNTSLALSWPELNVYLMMSFLSNAMLTESEFEISAKILNGTIAMDLLKPLDFQKVCFAELLGKGLFEGIISIVMAGMIFGGLGTVITPTSPVTWVFFLISFLLSIMIKFCILYLTGLLSFWTTSVDGLVWLRIAIVNFFSGAIIPLPFFPPFLEQIALVLPFQGMVHTPTLIYLEQGGHWAALQAIGIQAAWVIALWLCGTYLWRWAIQKVTIHGG